MGGCLVPCSTFNSISALYPLDANNNPPLVMTPPPHGPKCPLWCRGEDTISLLEKHWVKRINGWIITKLKVAKGREIEMRTKGAKVSMETVNLDPCTEALTMSYTYRHNRYIGWRPVKRPPGAPLAKVKMCFWVIAQPPTSLEIFWALCTHFFKRHWLTNFFGERESIAL